MNTKEQYYILRRRDEYFTRSNGYLGTSKFIKDALMFENKDGYDGYEKYVNDNHLNSLDRVTAYLIVLEIIDDKD
jgi:hypothetical protein